MPSKIELRPQPLGISAGPPSALLLPVLDDGSDQERIEQVLMGLWPAAGEEPPPWRFFFLACRGELEAAVASLKELVGWAEGNGQTWLIDYNLFVLTADRALYEKLAPVLEDEPGLLLAVVAYLHGTSERPPASGEAAAGEIAAFLESTAAHFSLAGSNAATGLSHMRRALDALGAISPAFSARLHSEIASISLHQPELYRDAIEHGRHATEILKDTGFDRLRGELSLELGMSYQQLSAGRKDYLLSAISAYQEALLYFPKDGPDPSSYGLAQMNLGLVYLSMPMTDEAERLRPAIAIQALREALRVFPREKDARMWSSATLNLANALQHVPSTHAEDNLWESVALYQDILEVRSKEDDPVSYARVLANQGNALAHLGAFSRAMPVLEESKTIFEEAGDRESADTVSELLSEIERRRAEIGNL